MNAFVVLASIISVTSAGLIHGSSHRSGGYAPGYGLSTEGILNTGINLVSPQRVAPIANIVNDPIDVALQVGSNEGIYRGVPQWTTGVTDLVGPGQGPAKVLPHAAGFPYPGYNSGLFGGINIGPISGGYAQW